MSSKKIAVHFIIMFFTVASYAQKRQGGAMHWEIASCIPAAEGQPKALGLAGPVVGVHNDVLVVGGGANFPGSMPWQGGKKKYYSEAFVYFKNGEKIKAYSKKYQLPFAVAYAASCSSSQGIVYAGGENDKGISDKVYLLQWNKNDSDLIARELPGLPVALTNASAVVHGDVIFIAGGETAQSVSSQFYCLDLNSPDKGWQQLPAVPRQVSHAVAIVQSHNNHSFVYLIGGRKKNTGGLTEFYSSVYRFDIANNKWEEKSQLPYALSAAAGVAIGKDRLMIVGGDKGKTFHRVEQLILDIQQEKSEAKKQMLTGQKNKLQASHPGFGKEILVYDMAADKWTMADHLPFDAPVTTTAVQWDNRVIVPGGEIRAGVRTPFILSAKPALP